MSNLRIEYFMKLVECGSFTDAAAKLFVSQPALSKQISALEGELGFKLLNRNYGSVSMTEAGSIMYDFFADATLGYQNAVARARLTELKQESWINVGLLEDVELGNIPDIIKEFHNKSNSVYVSVERCPIGDLRVGMQSDKFDLIVGITSAYEDKGCANETLLMEARNMLLIGKNHPLASKKNLSPEDFNNQRFYIPIRRMNDIYARFEDMSGSYSFSPKERILLPNMESVLMALGKGRGAAIITSMTHLPDPENYIFVPLEVKTCLVATCREDCTNQAVFNLLSVIKERFIPPASKTRR